MLSKATLFGFNFTSASSIEEIADLLMENNLEAIGPNYNTLITPNAYTLVQYNEPANKWLKDFYSHSPIILPDGMPVVWMSKLKNKGKLEQRLPGSDLFAPMWNRIKAGRIPATMVLPSEIIAEKFNTDYSQVQNFVPDFFNPADEKYIAWFVMEVVDGIIKHHSRFVFLGLTFPKQEILGIRIIEQLKARKYPHNVLILLLGASFEFYFGMKDRAPEFYQKNGLEWLYRFAREPRRLWKRYTVDNMRFMLLALRELLKI